MMDYRAAYRMVVDLQEQLQAEVLAVAEQELQQKEHLRRLDYKQIQALAATYELQAYLANKITDDWDK